MKKNTLFTKLKYYGNTKPKNFREVLNSVWSLYLATF